MGKHSHSSEGMWKKLYWYKGNALYSWPHIILIEESTACRSQLVINNESSLLSKLWSYFGTDYTFSVIWNHEIHYCLQISVLLVQVQWYNSWLVISLLKSMKLCPVLLVVYLTKLSVEWTSSEFWLRDRERRWEKISWLSAGKNKINHRHAFMWKR